jgi:hypothetical protein
MKNNKHLKRLEEDTGLKALEHNQIELCITWEDSEVTKVRWGKTWTNGQTQILKYASSFGITEGMDVNNIMGTGCSLYDLPFLASWTFHNDEFRKHEITPYNTGAMCMYYSTGVFQHSGETIYWRRVLKPHEEYEINADKYKHADQNILNKLGWW